MSMNDTSKHRTSGLRKLAGLITGKVLSAINGTKTQRLVQNTLTRYSAEAPRGSGYCEDQVVRVFRVTEWRVRGALVWRTRESIGSLASNEWISSATLGSRF